MSLVSSIVDRLVEPLLKQVKERLEEFTDDLIQDLELFANRMIRKAVKTMALAMVGAALLCVGSLFALVGVVAYLSPVVGTALAWGLVGVVTIAIGAVMLLVLIGRQNVRKVRGAAMNGKG